MFGSRYRYFILVFFFVWYRYFTGKYRYLKVKFGQIKDLDPKQRIKIRYRYFFWTQQLKSILGHLPQPPSILYMVRIL